MIRAQRVRRFDPLARIHFVYFVFDADGVCIYVGCTYTPRRRWANHRTASPGMVAAARSCRMRGPFVRQKALEIEQQEIARLAPMFNAEAPGYNWAQVVSLHSKARAA